MRVQPCLFSMLEAPLFSLPGRVGRGGAGVVVVLIICYEPAFVWKCLPLCECIGGHRATLSSVFVTII